MLFGHEGMVLRPPPKKNKEAYSGLTLRFFCFLLQAKDSYLLMAKRAELLLDGSVREAPAFASIPPGMEPLEVFGMTPKQGQHVSKHVCYLLASLETAPQRKSF